MLFNIGVQHGRQYLLAVLSGAPSLDDYLDAAAFVASVAKRAGHRRALVDLLGAAPRLSAGDHRALGAGIARAWSALERVATVVPRIERVGLGEQAAQRHGLQLRTFTDLDAAARWLAEA
jgi:hypothetical protein